MIRRLWLFVSILQYPYTNPVDRQQARDLLRTMLMFALLLVLGQYIPIAAGVYGLSDLDPISFGLPPIVVVATVILIQTGRLRLAKQFFVGALIILASVLYMGGFENLAFTGFVIPIILAGTLLGRREVILVSIIVAITLAIGAFAQPTLLIRVDNPPSVLLPLYAILFFMVAVLIVFGLSPQSIAESFVNELRDLRQVVNATQFQSLGQSESELLADVLRGLRKEFDYRASHIYLLDDQHRQATRYYIGFGLDTLQVGENLDISTLNAIGECLRTNAVILVDETSSPARRRHLSAGLKGGLVLPLRYNNEVIGVLDLQTETDDRFSSTQIEAMEVYVSQLALAIQRNRLLRQLREDVSEQERLIIKQRQRVKELEQAQQGITTNWQTFFEQYTNGTFGYDVSGDGSVMTYARDLPDIVRMALEEGELVVTQENGQQAVSLPVLLRDQLLGAMSFKLPMGVTLTERQVELLRNVVQRLGLALENKRLFEQSQTQAQRESKANAVASTLLSSTDIDDVLQLASETFNEALGAISTQIFLQPQLTERKPEETS